MSGEGIEGGGYRFYSDKQFEWRPARIFIPAVQFTGLIGTAGVLTGSGTGAPVTQEISTFGIVAAMMDTAGDELDHFLVLPYDVDLKRAIRFRVHWTSASADTADTIDWKVFRLSYTPDVTTMAAAATVLSTVIAQDTVLGAYTYQVTSYGILNPAIMDQVREAIGLRVELDAFAAGLTEDKFFLGLEIVYTPKRMRGPDGMARGAMLPTTALGSSY